MQVQLILHVKLQPEIVNLHILSQHRKERMEQTEVHPCNICQHAIAAAEDMNVLSEYLLWVRRTKKSATAYC